MKNRRNLATEKQENATDRQLYDSDYVAGIELAERCSAKEEARKAPFVRIALWMFDLPLTSRQAMILGRVYSLQCSQFGDGDYHMSLANGAKELRIDKRDFRKALKELVERGYLVKMSNGPRVPASYIVDEAKCLRDAKTNGYGRKAAD